MDAIALDASPVEARGVAEGINLVLDQMGSAYVHNAGVKKITLPGNVAKI